MVQQFLPCEDCGDYTLNEIILAIIRTLCYLEAEIVVERERIDDIESEYDMDCITTSGSTNSTHDVLQSVINKVCNLELNITQLNNDMDLKVNISDIYTYIQAYLNAQSGGNNLMCNRMVPYVVYPFYPTGTVMMNFNIYGVGSGEWANVYLCNGWGGMTPDLRGRTIVGMTDMGGVTTDPTVAPGGDNPAYTLGMPWGWNSVALSADDIPAHSHPVTSSVTDPGHYTQIVAARGSSIIWDAHCAGCSSDEDGQPIVRIESLAGINTGTEAPTTVTTTNKAYTGISVNVSAGNNTTSGLRHTNIQPVKAMYYIMYVPA